MYMRIIALLILSLFLISGCQQNNNQESLPNQNEDKQMINVKNSSSNTDEELNNEDIANHLANIASDVPHVNDAVAIIAGPYAVVGIDVAKDADRSEVGTVKYSVSEALQHDPYGKTAVVIADGDVMERLRMMAYQIQQGQPVQGIVEELSSLVGRYIPNFPINENKPVEPDQNKEMIPEDEKEKLDDIQDDQSNQHLQN